MGFRAAALAQRPGRDRGLAQQAPEGVLRADARVSSAGGFFCLYTYRYGGTFVFRQMSEICVFWPLSTRF